LEIILILDETIGYAVC